ncbi:hypothetical protein [Streptomyces halstedii]|nr:hypothetical protein [Streptomyces halstedii]
MADEQDEWLDADTAENLLRGDRVEPDDAPGPNGAWRLDALLRAVRTPGPSAGELPGEEGVLAAFREASGAAARKRDGAARSTGPAGRQDIPRSVRIGPARPAPFRRPRWTRPVRYGLAVSLAGCALGGVAVAGSSGMLPGPFGGQGAPVPASSVSSEASPRELGAEVPGADPSAPPSGSASPPVTPGKPEEAGQEDGRTEDGGDPAGGGGDPDGDDTATGRGSSDGAGGTGEGDASGGATAPSPGRTGESATEAYGKSLRVCRKYRDDALSGEDRRRLLELARGERNVERFCDRLLGEEGGDEDGRSGGGKNGADGGGHGSGGDEDGGTSLPPISFRTADPDPDPDGDGSPFAAPTSSTDLAATR